MDRQAEVFKLSVPEADIADPRERLKHARLQTRRPVRPGRTAPMSDGFGGWSIIGGMILIGVLRRCD